MVTNIGLRSQTVNVQLGTNVVIRVALPGSSYSLRTAADSNITTPRDGKLLILLFNSGTLNCRKGTDNCQKYMCEEIII